MQISRRGFLKLITSAIASGAIVPAFAARRQPYVAKGQSVSWVGACPGGFIGSEIVAEVGDWDGLGYPVKCYANNYLKPTQLNSYYDFDLCDFLREVPKNFWHYPGSSKYPNVHTWIREQRFGETVSEAIKYLNFASIKPIQ